jgi:hypothetical protein
MAAATTGPLTLGQLSQLRDTASLPPDARYQANVWRVGPLPPGVSVAAIRDAVIAIRARHAALRSTYHLDTVEQVVRPAGELDYELPVVPVPDGAVPDVFAYRLVRLLTTHAFDLTVEEPWRIVVVTTDGVPSHLLSVLHHVAVDLWSERLVTSDYETLLSGGSFTEPAASPLELALAQHSPAGLAERAASADYLREVYTAAARTPARGLVASPKVLVNAVLDSRIAVTGAMARAAEIRSVAPSFSVPSLILAAFCHAAHRIFGVADILVHTLSNNRLQPGSATLVSNMVQWARLVSQYTPGEPFEDFAARVHENSLRAYRFGCYDVDLDQAIRQEVESTVGPIGCEISLNYAQAEPDPLPADVSHWRLRKVPAPYYGGPAFYLMVYYGTSHLELTGRTRLEDVSHGDMEAFLRTIHELLLPR